MVIVMNSKINKTFRYFQKYGFFETFKKIGRTIQFRLKVKFSFNRNGIYKLTKTELSHVTLKSGKKHVYIFMNIPYYDVGGGQRGSQLAKTFNKMGFLVDYLYLQDSSETKKHKMDLPLNSHRKIQSVNLEQFEKNINSSDLFIFESPSSQFIPFLEIAQKNKCPIIYESIDNWETSLGNLFFERKNLKKFLSSAKVLVGTSKLLVEQLQNYLKEFKIKNKEVYYLPNAVDSDLFDCRLTYQKPVDLKIGEKTLLYYGSLWGEWFDWELVFTIATELPNVSINLIGEYSNILDIVSRAPKNVHFLGLKKQIDLPHYLAYSDFAILPFRTDEIGQYVSPLKIFEYIAMNRTVLSTDLLDISGYPNVYASNDVNEWIDIINQEVKHDYLQSRMFVCDNDWYHRCTKLLDYSVGERKCNPDFYNNISLVILNYNNKNVIFECIQSILKFNAKYQCEIIVVDNQSTDGSYEMLEKQDGIKLYRNDKNGCSSGRNLGIQYATKKYVMFLDSDQWILHQDWLDNYIDIFLSDHTVGAIGWAAGWFNRDGYSYHVVDSFPYKYMPPMVLYRNDIGYLGTGGMMLERELLNSVGGFDLFYDPTCYEDTDLSLKIRDTSMEIVYCSYLGVGHLPHQTTKSGSDAHDKLIKEKGDYFVKKWKNKNPDLLKYTK